MCEVTGPALVLGSTQPDAHLDRAAVERSGLDVVRRRSGGGAVLVEPDAVAWVDVVVPAGDPLWEQDVGRAFWWLGATWAAVLAGFGLAGASVHRGALVTSPWSPMVCFAGLGPGEVTVAGRKTVGMAQRRSRHASLFQCAVPLRWEPSRLLSLLALDEGQRHEALADLSGAVGEVRGRPAAQVAEAFTGMVLAGN